MRMFVTTAAMIAALTVSAFAEGEPTGTEAQGEADGSFKLSAQQPPETIFRGSSGQLAMAQGTLPSEKVKGAKASKAKASTAKASKAKALKANAAASDASASKASAKEGEVSNDTGYSAESLKSPTGMDGGNRK
jgi:hypothetical protein